MTTGTILFLDLLCILWVIAVMSNPFGFLVNVLTGMYKILVWAFLVVPIVYGTCLLFSGVDGILGHVILAYVMELVGIGVVLGGLFSLHGIFTAIKGVWAVYCCMIALPCWFIIGSIAYLTW